MEMSVIPTVIPLISADLASASSLIPHVNDVLCLVDQTPTTTLPTSYYLLLLLLLRSPRSFPKTPVRSTLGISTFCLNPQRKHFHIKESDDHFELHPKWRH